MRLLGEFQTLLMLAITVTTTIASFAFAESPNTVVLPNGSKLTGIVLQSTHLKKDYVEFRGIPYAHPPVGSLRFRPAVLLDENLGVQDATNYGSICPQLDPWYDPDETEGGSWEEMKILGDENCLLANVASANINPEHPLPVLVWFHAGNFQSESGQDYSVGKLLDHDLVVVTFNYRLGVLGFLNTDDDSATGNMGLKDQSVLLEWVKKNIRSFGGNPDMITVAGSNAGAASIHLHMLSPMSEGLFHQAIIMSGTAISPWVFTREPAERNKKLAKLLKCGNDTTITECITSSDAKALVQKTHKMTVR